MADKDEKIMIDERELFKNLAQYSNEERKMEYIENILKKNIPLETRKIALHLLGDMHKKKSWYNTAAKYYSDVADLCKTFDEKANFFFQAGEMFVKANDYFTAEDYFKRVLVLVKPSEKEAYKDKMLNVFIKHAQDFENNKRTASAIQAYNKILTFKLPIDMANKIRDKLIVLYEKIGNIREANHIRSVKELAISMAEEEKAKQKAAEEEKRKEQQELHEGFSTLDEFS